MKDSIIIARPGTYYFDRGENSKFFESREIEKILNEGGTPGWHPYGGGVAHFPENASKFQSGQPSKKVKIETARVHQNGCIKFLVDKAGDQKSFKYLDKEILFLEDKPYNSKGPEKYRGKVKLPDKSWTATVIYFSGKTQDYFLIYPPSVDALTEELEGDMAKYYPHQFFEKDCFEICHFLEKWAGWKFHRGKSGFLSANVSGQTEFAYTNPVLNKTIPKGMSGSPDIDHSWVDESPGLGEKEIETSQVKNTLALLKAGENFEGIDKRLQEIDDQIRERQLKLRELDLEFTEKEIKLKQKLSHLYDAIDDSLTYEELKLKLKRAQKVISKSDDIGYV